MLETVHLIRHGQSTFNLASAESPYVDPMLFDAPLTSLGRAQAEALAETVAGMSIELVVTSPLTRAIETTLIAFGNRVPVEVQALATECVSVSCDIGRTPNQLARDFPNLRFGHLEERWWYSNKSIATRLRRGLPVEPESAIRSRVAAFRSWLARRPEREVAIIGHGSFFVWLCGERFNNCEIRSLSGEDILAGIPA